MNNYFSDKELHLYDATTQEKIYMYYLRDELLNKVREALGPITCTSGHRNEKHNKEVGGATNSHHLCKDGYAACDLNPHKCSLEELWNYIKDNCSYAELILEYDQGIVHVSTNINPMLNVKRTSKRKIINNKRTYY